MASIFRPTTPMGGVHERTIQKWNFPVVNDMQMIEVTTILNFEKLLLQSEIMFIELKKKNAITLRVSSQIY